MKLVTRQDKANSAASDFAQIFRSYSYDRGYRWVNPSYEEVYNKLLALGKNPSPGDVDKIMPGWLASTCWACQSSVDTVVQVYESDDRYEDHDVDLCLDCLKIASDLAETAR